MLVRTYEKIPLHWIGIGICRVRTLVTGCHQCEKGYHDWTNQYVPVNLKYKCHVGNSSKPPIVVCHGLLGSHQNWNGLAKSINQKTGRSIYIPDMRNHGSSPHSDNMTYYDMASDINNFIQRNTLGNAVVIGNAYL